jgi:hypothetical protein
MSIDIITMYTPRKSITSDLKTIEELLLQPYPLDPGSLEYLIEQSINLFYDGPVRIICNILRNKVVNSIDRDNMSEFIRRSSTYGNMKLAFGKSLKSIGRCPKKERNWLRVIMNQQEVKSLYKPIIPSAKQGETVLDISDLSGNLKEFPEFIERMSKLDKISRSLIVNFSKFTYASALAVVAQWILANNFVRKYDLSNTPEEMLVYLKNIGFEDALVNPKINISQDLMDWAVGLTRINKDLPTEEVTKKIVDILDTFINPTPSDRSALFILIAEMIENVHRHSKSKVDGFAVAQVYPKKLKMGVTLVDAGIGIKESFNIGNPSIPIDNLTTDEDFLRESVKLHSTSKRDEHSGYGLYILSELIGKNRGTFLLTSGMSTLVGYYKNGKTVFDCYHHSYWQGTIVSVVLDLQRPLPINQIYDEMPTLPGEDNDLFIF